MPIVLGAGLTHAGRYAEAALRDDGSLAKGVAVIVYQAGTSTPAVLFVDRDRSASASNPVITDPESGMLTFWANADTYDLVGDRITMLAVPVAPAGDDVAPLDAGGLIPTSVLRLGADAGTVAAGNDPRIGGAELSANKGTSGGYAPLDTNAHVPATYLPVGSGPGTVAAGDDPRIGGGELVANKGHAGGYAPLDSTSLVPVANIPSAPILPRRLVFYGHSYFRLTAAVLLSAGFRTDELVQALCGVDNSQVVNRAVTGCQLLAEGAVSGGYATALQYEPKSARTAPYVGQDGAAVLCWGINDIGNLGNTSQVRTAFAHALRAVISRHRAASVREHTDASVATSGGSAVTTALFNSGAGYYHWTSTGGSFTITLPADFPGGTIGIGIIGAAGAFGGVITWSGTASVGTSGTTSTSAIMPTGVVHGHICRRLVGLTAADAGKTIIGTVTSLDSGGEVGFDYWQIEAPVPPLTVVCNVPRLRDSTAYSGYSGGIGDTDVTALNGAIASVVAEFDSAVVLADVDTALGKTTAWYAVDGVHPNELGARALAGTIVTGMAAAGRILATPQLVTDVDTAAADSLSMLTSGEEAIPRTIADTAAPLDAGTVHLTYFTARRTEIVSTLHTATGGVAAAALTLARMGLYAVDDSTGNLSLVASCASDTTLWGGAYTAYERAVTAPYVKIKGRRYAYAMIALGTTMPQVKASYTSATESALSPRICGVLTGQTNLPSSITGGSVAADYRLLQGLVLPS